jgi:hypothetical protein
MDTKNIPVSIYAHYKCLPFIYNKQFTTHPVTVNFSIQSCLLREISLLSGNFPCESQAGCCDRSLERTVGKLYVTQASGAFIH